MDKKTAQIIAAKLKKWKGEVITKEMLVELRDEIYKKTRKNRFAPFSNLKKWIKAVRKEMRAKENVSEKLKPKAPKPIPQKVEESVAELKAEVPPVPPTPTVVEIPKPPIIFDKVYLQTIQYEISGMRQLLERISRQLDKLEKELSAHRKEE